MSKAGKQIVSIQILILLFEGIIAAVRWSKSDYSARFLFTNQQTQFVTVTQMQPKAVGLSPNSTKKKIFKQVVLEPPTRSRTRHHTFIFQLQTCALHPGIVCVHKQTTNKSIHEW